MRQPGEALSLPHRLLATRPLVGLGLISYSFYLWHWPLLAGFRYYSFTPASVGIRLALVAAALGIACLSWRFVEQPFRQRARAHSCKSIFAHSAVAAVVLLAAAGLIGTHAGYPSRLSPLATRFAAGKHDANYLYSHHLTDVPANLVRGGAKTSTAGVFLWGDSHAAAALPGLDAACRQAGVPITAAFSSSTAPVLDWFFFGEFGINEAAIPYNAAVLGHIQAEATAGRLSSVILAARWTSYIDDKRAGASFPAALERTLDALLQTGCKVVILQEAPFFAVDIPRTLALQCSTVAELPRFAMNPATYAARTRSQTRLFAKHPSVLVLNPATPLSDSAGRILPADANGSFFRDSHHLSIHGSVRVFHDQEFLRIAP
jgi:hypothetical protein